MPDPILFVVDHDPEILKCIAEALERRFGVDYRVLTDGSPTSALSRMEQACERGEQVALVIADFSTPEMSGLELLDRARVACPKASRCVLVSWGDGEGFLQVRRALVTGQVDTFLIRPCDAAGDLDRIRAVRSRARRLHRRRPPQARPLRAGGGRHPVPRRGG